MTRSLPELPTLANSKFILHFVVLFNFEKIIQSLNTIGLLFQVYMQLHWMMTLWGTVLNLLVILQSKLTDTHAQNNCKKVFLRMRARVLDSLAFCQIFLWWCPGPGWAWCQWSSACVPSDWTCSASLEIFKFFILDFDVFQLVRFWLFCSRENICKNLDIVPMFLSICQYVWRWYYQDMSWHHSAAH